ncbi:hypothetical protein O7632_13835 [Solwaraspora sp. WMMD406]|uniref:hypothetical protein n=1 Tax=Solwaraspora sp. WMMD406 TaxID=3016095 RepID=UPI00241627EF|nr:hypothetical protein [Solwaraspora sp. WMMD406]MDG4765168.1 hypothetical protein [Solwaraspora sp. WMMD406]
MLIDCDTCTVRGAACGGCLVNALIEAPRAVARLDSEERHAVEVFARAGFEVEVLDEPVGPIRRRSRRPRSRRQAA